jgi:hypothetical protein
MTLRDDTLSGAGWPPENTGSAQPPDLVSGTVYPALADLAGDLPPAAAPDHVAHDPAAMGDAAFLGTPAAGVPDPGTTAFDPDDPFGPLSLPDVTRRGQTRLRRRERKRQRRRRLLRGAALAVAAAMLVALLAAVWPSARRHAAAKTAPTAKSAAAAQATTPVLIAQVDPAGNAVSLLLLVPAAKDRGGTLLLLPPGTMTEVASLGLQPLGQSLGLGGAKRLQATLENLLGVPIGSVLALDDAHLAQLVQPAGPLDVKVPDRVETVESSGQVDVVFEPGPHQLTPSDVPRFLSVKGAGNDLDRLVRHQKFFEAWLARMKAQPSAVPAGPPELRKALAALMAGPFTTRVLPVHSIGATDAGELYQVDSGELQSLVSSVFPGNKPGAAERPRVQVLNGTRLLGMAQKAADQLVPAGFQVTLTGNAGRLDFDETQVVFYRQSDLAVAQRVQKALGLGRIVLSRDPIDVIDVTVIVGRDYQPQ